MTKDHVFEIFSNFGNITDCHFQTDKNKAWLSSGNAYVEYEKPEEVDECIKKMNGGKLKVGILDTKNPLPILGTKILQSWVPFFCLYNLLLVLSSFFCFYGS